MANEWLKILSEANSARADVIPPGYKTADELAKHFGKSKCTIDRHMPRLLESGVMVRAYFKRVDRAGRLVTAPHYKQAK